MSLSLAFDVVTFESQSHKSGGTRSCNSPGYLAITLAYKLKKVFCKLGAKLENRIKNLLYVIMFSNFLIFLFIFSEVV